MVFQRYGNILIGNQKRGTAQPFTWYEEPTVTEPEKKEEHFLEVKGGLYACST